MGFNISVNVDTESIEKEIVCKYYGVELSPMTLGEIKKDVLDLLARHTAVEIV